MAYATVEQFRQYANQANDTPEEDALIEDVLDRATSIVDGALGFSFGGYSAAVVRSVRSPGIRSLIIPPHRLGSITSITADEGPVEVQTDYEVRSPVLLYRWDAWPEGRIRITAEWGYGTAPAALEEVTLEIAVNIWRGKGQGLFTDVIGVDGGNAVGYQGALTNQQKMVIAGIKRSFEARYGL